MSNFYNSYHKCNNKIEQKDLIRESNFTYQTLISLIRKYFVNGKDVLDIGCGVGTIDFYLANRGFVVTGLDISDIAINKANKTKLLLGHKNLNFICSSVEKFSSKYNYDYCICSEVIEHVNNDKLIINRIFERVKINGLLIISTPLSSAPLYRMGLLNGFDKSVGHLRRYSVEELSNLVIKSNFEVIEVVKVEGLLRNLLFTHGRLGIIVRFLKGPIKELFNILDKITIRIFGASNVYLVCRRKK